MNGRGWAVVGVAAVGVVWAAGAFGAQPTAPLQGDQLGPETGEDPGAYVARADSLLAEADDATPTYALVTFQSALSVQDAAKAVGEAGRVNALLVGASEPIALPEPIAGADRADVFDAALDQTQAGLDGIGRVEVPRELSAVVVWDTGEVLREVAAAPEVAAVEPAPDDAAWGSFAIRPPGAL
ncbi:hypothetical protein [Corynebacterium confusum]|uniref:hypothetical protein n=1 Tax=Corynebacterium confusum TaxID=71254 RepID=UPI0025B520EB|nr:hypothetical protein [Corynebacterium confusum]WJY90071.1 hypothetical protein CCONF_07745 [Corynebacterium confusum]